MLTRILLAVFMLLAANLTCAQTLPPDLQLQELTAALDQPISVRAPHDGSERLFIVERCGALRIFKQGALVVAPALTLSVACGGEQGLLALAFHPNFAQNRKLYVLYTRPAVAPRLGFEPDQVLSEYQMQAGDPDLVDVSSARELMVFPDIGDTHNGADLAFSSDGLLHVTMGDGGGTAGDPNQFSQNLWRRVAGGLPFYLLGKMLRIDVDSSASPAPEVCGANGAAPGYAIPAANPLVGITQRCQEILHYGLRNAYRFSFDRRTAELYIADVGEGQIEEINVVAPGAAGLNFGWNCWEGLIDTQRCAPAPVQREPILTYTHASGPGGFRCAIIGGYVYRGSIVSLQGGYFYADFCSGELFFATPSGGALSAQVWIDNNRFPTGFGEDQRGELYLVDNSGRLYRITSPSGDGEILFGTGFE